MIIKFLPETDAEKARMKEQFGTDRIIHKNVKEYFVFGNKKISEGQNTDFHEWVGSHRYLMSNLNYFYELVNDERRNNESSGSQSHNKPMKFVDISKGLEEDREVMDIKADIERPRLIKHGTVNEQNVSPIDVSNIKKPKVVHMTAQELENIGEKLQKDVEKDYDEDFVGNFGENDDNGDFDANAEIYTPPPSVKFVKGNGSK